MVDMCYKYADYIIRKANKDGKNLSNKRLQKILFYSYVMYSKESNVPMFEERFRAWPNGPVLEEIYEKYSQYQNGKMQPHSDGNVNNKKKEECLLKAYNLLINVEEIDKIIAKTHNAPNNEESPWKKHFTKDVFEILKDEDVIPFEEIKNFYNKNENYEYLMKI